MKIEKSNLKDNNGYLSGDQSCVDKQTVTRALNYKKKVAGMYISLNASQIKTFMPDGDYFVTKKIDGELQVIFFNGTDLFSINGYGNIKMGFVCFEELKKNLISQEIKSCVLAGELHINEKDGRKRIYDLLKALGTNEKKDDIRLSLFDILEIDEKTIDYKNYKEKYESLKTITSGCEKAGVVPFKEAKTKDELINIFDSWYKENAEGLVVQGNFPRIYKIKPKHNFDVAVVGYSESEEKGKIRSLLVALMTEDNRFQIIGKVGTGFDENLKTMLFEKLSKMHAESGYIETDSNNVAFHMVKPELVIEAGCNDILTDFGGANINNPLLDYKDNTYVFNAMMNGISLLFPVFERIREDKKVNSTDIRWSQINDLVYVNHVSCQKTIENLPKSEIIDREIYKKEFKGKTMVQKFIIWKTNKEDADNRFTSYVFNYTNFSPDRKDPLDRDVRISNSLDQIKEIKKTYILENIKKGWDKVDLS